MPKYRLMASYGFAGSTMEVGEVDDMTQEEAEDEAWAAACERVDSWVEKLSDKETENG